MSYHGFESFEAWDEERHRCECRWLMKIAATEGWAKVETHFFAVARRRGQEAGARLKRDIKSAWKAKNRGEYGDNRGFGVAA